MMKRRRLSKSWRIQICAYGGIALIVMILAGFFPDYPRVSLPQLENWK